MSLSKEEITRAVRKVDMELATFIGFNTLLLFSKEVFKKNSDIDDFLSSVYGIKFLPYVFRSRTIIIAKLSRNIKEFEKNDINSHLEKMRVYFDIDNYPKPTKKRIKSNNANEKLDKWWSKL